MWSPAIKDRTTTQLLHLRLRECPGKGAKRFEKPEDQKDCYDIMSPRNDRKTSHKTSIVWLPKQDLNHDLMNRHALGNSIPL